MEKPPRTWSTVEAHAGVSSTTHTETQPCTSGDGETLACTSDTGEVPPCTSGSEETQPCASGGGKLPSGATDNQREQITPERITNRNKENSGRLPAHLKLDNQCDMELILYMERMHVAC